MLLSVRYEDTNDLIGISVIWETYSPIPGRPAPESSGSADRNKRGPEHKLGLACFGT
jgi:hypothetical protein